MRFGSIRTVVGAIHVTVEQLERRRLLSGTTYHLSPSGNDANSGTTVSLAWKTLARADKQTFHPGDSLLLQGGATFAGNLLLNASDSGTQASPVSVSSYGTGWATISAGNGDGITDRDAGGISVSDLFIVGSGPQVNKGSGIDLLDDQSSKPQVADITIAHVTINGFGFVGIGIGSTTVKTGFTDVSITYSSVYNNNDAGIFSYAGAYTANPAQYGLAHSNIFIARVNAYDNPGHAGSNDSGNGIELGNVNGATIQYCRAYGNGAKNNSTVGGPVGIWTYNSNRVLIQLNESYSNQAAHTDGDGFDLDGGTTNSFLQYNYSYENAGAGILEAQFAGAYPSTGNIIRGNLCQNDGRDQLRAAIVLWSASASDTINGTQISGNVIFMAKTQVGSPCAVLIESPTKNVTIQNNMIEMASGLKPLVIESSGSDLVIINNKYYTGTDLNIDETWLTGT